MLKPLLLTATVAALGRSRSVSLTVVAGTARVKVTLRR